MTRHRSFCLQAAYLRLFPLLLLLFSYYSYHRTAYTVVSRLFEVAVVLWLTKVVCRRAAERRESP